MAIPIIQGADTGLALSRQLRAGQASDASTRSVNVNTRAKRLEIEDYILNADRRKAERSLGIDVAESQQRVLPSQEGAAIAQNEASTMENEEFQAKKAVVLRGLQQKVKTEIAERTVGSKGALDDTAKLTLDNNIAQLFVEGQETRTQLLGNAFSSVDDQDSYSAVLQTLPKMGIDPISLSLGPKYNAQNKAKVEALREAAILTIEAQRKIGEIKAQMQPPASKALQAVTMNIPDGKGGYTKQEVFRNIDANSNVSYMDSNKNPITLPEGSHEATVGSTPTDIGAKLKGVAPTDLAYLATSQSQMEYIDKQLFNRDGSVNRGNLLMASAIPMLGKGVPFTEGRTLAANLGSVMSNALFIRSGKQSRVDEKSDVYSQLLPNGLLDSDQTIKVKYMVMKNLINGSLDIIQQGPDGLPHLDIEATLLGANQLLNINQEKADAAIDNSPEKGSVTIPKNQVRTKGGYTVPRVGGPT